MIKAFRGEKRRVGPLTDTTSIETLRQGIWIDLLNAAADEIDRVQRATGLTVPSEADVSEIESSSRLATRDGALYLSMPLIRLSDDGPRTTSVGFVVSSERFISVRFASSRVFDGYAEHLPRGAAVHEGGAHIFVGLLEAIIDRQADALEQVR